MTTQVVESKRMPWMQVKLSEDDFVDSSLRVLFKAEKQCKMRTASESVLASIGRSKEDRQASCNVAVSTSNPMRDNNVLYDIVTFQLNYLEIKFQLNYLKN